MDKPKYRYGMSAEEFLRRTKMREVLDLPEFIEELVIEVGHSGVKYTIRAAAQSKENEERRMA